MAISIARTMVLGKAMIQGTLLSAVAATGDGEWIDIAGFATASVDVTITGVATVLVRGSNAPTRPADNVDGFSLHSHTATGGGIINVPCRWVKAHVSAWTSGTVTVYLYAIQD